MRTLARWAREAVTLALITATSCLGANALDGAARPDASAHAFNTSPDHAPACAAASSTAAR